MIYYSLLGVVTVSAPSYGIKNPDHHELVAGLCQEIGIHVNLMDKHLVILDCLGQRYRKIYSGN
ncbi:TPA: hypothetical protein ACNBBS_003022 [Legionella pneumophila]|uniref:hypothetical protein n=1 Tax=Legionella pneumophila TaxID=446 RepID=UPI0004B5D583|nr:hypothetical protein [Legionella pneumophila]MBG1731419.1 hypothetical protein [Legionella pneumophila]MCW8427645.1 hypothetical protein [Legionella pneumophila]HAT1868924.1 hypothetical protein [Legionella pneumophila]HAT1896626.1 hypothetical protein [Legionella pneumophila]HAT1908993.1 hypothetical protein [Legionella pneumophila]